jgi:hypothetical protein
MLSVSRTSVKFIFDAFGARVTPVRPNELKLSDGSGERKWQLFHFTFRISTFYFSSAVGCSAWLDLFSKADDFLLCLLFISWGNIFG